MTPKEWRDTFDMINEDRFDGEQKPDLKVVKGE